MPNNDDYFRSRTFKQMLEEFERNEQNGVPNVISSEDYTDIAEFYYDKGDMSRAAHVADTAAEMYPGASAPLLFKARMELIDCGNTEQAEQIAELIEDKTDIDYFYLKAELMLARGQAAEAEAYLEERYTEIDDDDQESFLVDAASLFLNYDETDISERWAARCTDCDINEYKELRARLATAREDYETSMQLYKELLDEDPYSTEYWNALASVQLLSDDPEASINSSEYSLAIDPDNALGIFNMANGLVRMENYKDALTYYKRYIKTCPPDEEVEMLIGICLFMLNEYEEAIQHLQKALELSVPESSNNMIDIHRTLALALGETGRMDDALAELDLFVASGGDSHEAIVWRCYLLHESGLEDEAEALFLHALDNPKYDAEAFVEAIAQLYDNEEPAMAYHLYSLLFKHMPKLHKGRASFAACCHDIWAGSHDAGLWNEFVDNVRQAAEYEPEEASKVLGHLFPYGMKPFEYYNYLIDKGRR